MNGHKLPMRDRFGHINNSFSTNNATIFCREIKKIEPEAKIIFWDERLSTVAATRSLIEADMSRKKRKKVVDKMAAVFILQGWLDSHPQL